MEIKKIKYTDYLNKIPKEGRHILAQQTDDKILVYQAYRHSIADYAVANQKFGGNDYSYNRMSWIKPNFLWMMYRCGWAIKPGQERVLGIWIKKSDFDLILANSAFTSFHEDIYGTRENWKESLEASPIRLQWDPDHDPSGEKEVRKAIQLGIKGDLLKQFGREMICSIIDVTEFVISQRPYIDIPNRTNLLVPDESIYIPEDEELQKRIGLKSLVVN